MKELRDAPSPHEIFSAEIEHIPSRVKRFLRQAPDTGGYEQTWEYFVGSYGGAFDLLAESTLPNWQSGQLAPPIFFLCRHSIELSIKSAIVEYASSVGQEPNIGGHSLLQLWSELGRQIQAAGYDFPDEWGEYCGKLVDHLHNVDPDGERFRFPVSRRGAAFRTTEYELRELAVAHWHIGMYCDGCIGMLDDLGRQDGS